MPGPDPRTSPGTIRGSFVLGRDPARPLTFSYARGAHSAQVGPGPRSLGGTQPNIRLVRRADECARSALGIASCPACRGARSGCVSPCSCSRSSSPPGPSCWPSPSRSGRAERANLTAQRCPCPRGLQPSRHHPAQLRPASAPGRLRDRLGDHGRGLARASVGWWPGGSCGRCARSRTTTREISATNLHERLHLAGPDDELKELADTFDELLDRLERSFAFERQFVANASHELRTPLAGMRTSLDVAMAKPGPVPAHIRTLADRLRRELDHVDRLLESFLTLAHTQQGPLGDESTVSLGRTRSPRDLERRADAISAMRLDVEQQHASGRMGHRQRDAALPHGRERDRQRHRPQPARRLGPRQPPAVDDKRARSSSRTAARSSTPTRSKASPSRSGVSAPSEPDRTTAPGWGWRSSPRSSRSTAALSTSKHSTTAGCASSITLPLAAGTAAGAPA